MIALSALQTALLQDPDAEKFYCVRIKDILLTSFYRDITQTDGVYLSSDLLAGIPPPESTASVDKALYEVTLADSSNELSNLYANDLIGALLRVQVGFVNPASNSPEIDELFVVYEGIVQGLDVSFETDEQGRVLVKVIGSNPMAALDATSAFYTSRESLRELNASDSAFDEIHEGSRSLSLFWGKS